MTPQDKTTLADAIGIGAILITGAVMGFLLCYALFVW
jgi:hypothetical protein